MTGPKVSAPGDGREGLMPLVVVWLLFFAYTATVAGLIQLVLLPYVFPAWHAGHGLLKGGDWVWFHELATALAERINSEGWAAWELRPEGQAPAGIAAALYAVTVPKPWAFIPVNAALHATATMLLVALVRPLVPDRRLAMLAALPFLLYPSAMTWYTQIHKDGFSIAGSLLFIHGWVRVVRQETWEGPTWRPLAAFAEIMAGVGLAWVVRPYLVPVIRGVGFGLVLITMAVLAHRASRRRLGWSRAAAGMALVSLALALMTPLTADRVISEAVQPEGPTSSGGRLSFPTSSGARPSLWGTVPGRVPRAWQSSGWLPAFVESKALALAVTRERFRYGYPDAGSNVDVDVAFRSVTDLFAYAPRAAVLAFFAPFPDQWLENGTSPATTLMRRVVAGEMIGVYLALALLPYGLWRWRHRPDVWLIALFCVLMLLIHAYVFTNIGALYRVRYGYLMPLVALGVAGLGTVYREWARSRRATPAVAGHGRA